VEGVAELDSCRTKTGERFLIRIAAGCARFDGILFEGSGRVDMRKERHRAAQVGAFRSCAP
jgi:hypothetical protein